MSRSTAAGVSLGDCERVVRAAIAERNRDYLFRATIALTMGLMFGIVMAFLLFMFLLIPLGVKWSAAIVASLAIAGMIAALRGQDPIRHTSRMGIARFQIASTARVPIEPFRLMVEAVHLLRSRIRASGATVREASLFLHDALASPSPLNGRSDEAMELLVRLQLAKPSARGRAHEPTMRAQERLTGT